MTELGSPGRTPTSVDIARAAGVSQATVSHVLNHPERVSPHTLQRVNEAMGSLGYVINGSARALRSGVGAAIGVLVLDVANPFWGEVIQGIESVSRPAAIPLLIGSSEEDPENEAMVLSSFQSQAVRGLIVAPTEAALPALRRLRARGLRVVMLDREDPEGEVESVSVDHTYGAALAARHVIEAGHRRVAFVNGSHRIWWCAARARGVHDVFDAVPDAELHEIEMRAMTAEEGARSIEAVLALRPAVTAVLCANDMLALGLVGALLAAGIRVPQDVSVVGYDDNLFASALAPALTTVRQDARALGRAAAERLLGADRLLDAHQLAEQVIHRPVLVVRKSVQTLASVGG